MTSLISIPYNLTLLFLIGSDYDVFIFCSLQSVFRGVIMTFLFSIRYNLFFGV